MDGLLHLVQRAGAWACRGPAQSPPRCTKCNSPPINRHCTNFISFDVELPLDSKGLKALASRVGACTSSRWHHWMIRGWYMNVIWYSTWNCNPSTTSFCLLCVVIFRVHFSSQQWSSCTACGNDAFDLCLSTSWSDVAAAVICIACVSSPCRAAKRRVRSYRHSLVVQCTYRNCLLVVSFLQCLCM